MVSYTFSGVTAIISYCFNGYNFPLREQSSCPDIASILLFFFLTTNKAAANIVTGTFFLLWLFLELESCEGGRQGEGLVPVTTVFSERVVLACAAAM